MIAWMRGGCTRAVSSPADHDDRAWVTTRAILSAAITGNRLTNKSSSVLRALRDLLPTRVKQEPAPAPALSYRYGPGTPGVAGTLGVHVVNGGGGEAEVAERERWCTRQTAPELRLLVFDRTTGAQVASHPARALQASLPSSRFFAAPGELPDLPPAHFECCLLLLAAECVDAVAVVDAEELRALGADPVAELWQGRLRRRAVFDRDAFVWDAKSDTVRPRRAELLVKVACTGVPSPPPAAAEPPQRARRGPYLSTRAHPLELVIELRAATRLARRPLPTQRTPLLVTTSFLARGGAEHTLFETLRHLQDRFEIAIATLAPHAPELGDRRNEFRAISERIFPLGDLVHPAAMPGMLRALLDSLGAQVLYNANGTTLFYEFAPALKRERPALRIVDHLYDHRVGYVDRYHDPALRDTIDVCVAENHRIAATLAQAGWALDRVPVIWPCGRAPASLPPTGARPELRRRLRRELGLAPTEIVFLCAARMHEQKRPLDLVAAARALVGTGAVFLLAGGGPLEHRVDRAIASAPAARILRLPFRDDVPDLIAAADVGCLVSDFEGLPVFLIECLQQGVPFLGTNVGDMGELLRETGAGLVIEHPGDVPAIAAAARDLLAPERRSELGAGAARAASRFSIAECARLYAQAFLGRHP